MNSQDKSDLKNHRNSYRKQQ